MGYLPIEEHGIVGDLHTAALVGTDGTVDWLCLPAFDSPSVFASILDDEKGGHFKLRPERYDRSQQLYLPDTNVLLTRFLSPEGVAEILDFMPVHKDGHARHRLVRNIKAIRGRVTLNLECLPAFDYARVGHSVALRKSGAVFLGSGLTLGLASPDVPVEVGTRGDVRARFELEAEESATFVLAGLERGERQEASFSDRTFHELVEDTLEYWRCWIWGCTYAGR